MSWLQTLADELTARGIRGADRRRIMLELRDHIDCEPGCELRLGDPAALAATFSDELACARTRRSALHALAALVATAGALALSQTLLGRLPRYPGFDRGLSQLLFWPALLGILIAPQAALVSGSLACLRVWRRRRAIALPAAELALIARRTRVALAAGLATATGLELYVVDFSQRLPAWWLALTGGLGAAAAAGLLTAWRSVALAGGLRSAVAGPPGDVYDDLPLPRWRWLRRGSWRLGALASLAVGMLMAAFEAHAEHSIAEGIQRGVVEGLAAAAGFAILGRAIGVGAGPRGRRLPFAAGSVRSDRPLDLPALMASPRGRRAGDADRAQAEWIVRDGFARGQITVEELSERVTAIHEAGTLGELRDSLTGLL